ncbi:MAG: YwaF family protein [Clostridia bacterium]|nr:YwaF family protein [Clostridia bacterium]
MSELMQSTAWRMDMPARYGVFHWVFTAILLALTIFAAWRLRHTNEKQNRVVLGVVGAFLLVTEVYKIAFHMTVNPYDWEFFGCFPFQLCSVPMYLCIVCALCKNERVNAWLYECMFAVNMFGGIMAFLEPSGIQHTYITLTVHAYVWHMMLVFVGFYLYASRRVCTQSRFCYKGIAVFLGTCVIAQVFNLVFAGEVNCFYISPYVQSPLAVFKDIYAACGWVVNMVLFIFGLTIAATLVYYIGYAARRLTAPKTARTEKQTV